MSSARSFRSGLLAAVCLTNLIAPAYAQPAAVEPAPRRTPPARAAAPRGQPRISPEGAIRAVQVEGNQRVEAGTIRSYMLVGPGDSFDPDRIDRSLKALYATGLFQDVALRRVGNDLVVKVAENPIVNRISFEGNRKLNDEQLTPELQLRSRAVFTPQLAQADRQRLLDRYAKGGRFGATVEPKIVRLDQNRVDVIFEITEGDTTLISRIAIVGNHAYSETRLREVISSREQAIYRILGTSDQYDPEHIGFDKELLNRFYFKNGYADFEVMNATAELTPDRRAFFVTFTIKEGEQYSIGKVSIDSKLRNLPGEQLSGQLQIQPGDVYDGDAVDRTVTAIQDEVGNRGFAFVDVKPRIARNRESHTVDLVFDVTEGPRVFVERIDIEGNTRTQDKVIRREFRFAEGDAFNAAAVRRTRTRLTDLGYFNSAVLSPSPGSAPDRAIVTARIDEKATGELTLGGGYSTDAGALVNAGLRERNLVGTGIDANVNGVLAQKRSEVQLAATDPYFLDRNLVAGFDLFLVRNNNQDIANYSERRTGGDIRLGYEFNDHLRQAFTYSLVSRNIYDVRSGASIYITDQAGQSILSQIGQTLTLDYRDSRTDPHDGFIVRLGTDFAGLGGDARYIRAKLDGSYFFPLEQFTGDPDWSVVVSAGGGYLEPLGKQEKIIDRFFLGGDNLRGFQSAGAGPHSSPVAPDYATDSLGGRLIYTQSTELRFPLPISADLGLSGRAFVDVGSLSQVNGLRDPTTGLIIKPIDDAGPRVGAGVGVSWKTPFGLINIDIADAVVKKKYDQTQLLIRNVYKVLLTRGML